MEVMTFRKAEAKDAGLLLYFIKELAVYEKMLDLVVATEETLQEWMFEKEKAEAIFVLENGKVFDCIIRIVNTAANDVTVTLPAGYVYESFKSATPLTIPASSRNILTITRTSDKTFLVTREELAVLQQ